MNLTLHLPDVPDLSALDPLGPDKLRLALARALYAQGRISPGTGAAIAGVELPAFTGTTDGLAPTAPHPGLPDEEPHGEPERMVAPPGKPAWMIGFGSMRDYPEEAAEIMRRVEEAFGQIEPNRPINHL